MFRLAPACRIFGLRPELLAGMVIVGDVFTVRGYVLEFSHGMDGVHSRASLHYNGCGIDGILRPDSNQAMSVTLKISITQTAVLALGQDFDFILEGLGTANEHWHLEFQPKNPY